MNRITQDHTPSRSRSEYTSHLVIRAAVLLFSTQHPVNTNNPRKFGNALLGAVSEEMLADYE